MVTTNKWNSSVLAMALAISYWYFSIEITVILLYSELPFPMKAGHFSIINFTAWHRLQLNRPRQLYYSLSQKFPNCGMHTTSGT